MTTIDRWIIRLLIFETDHVLVPNIFLVPLFSNIFKVYALQETVNHTYTEKQETFVFYFVFGLWKGSRDDKFRTNFTKLDKNELFEWYIDLVINTNISTENLLKRNLTRIAHTIKPNF
jgi:hypothetical protein